MELPIFYYAKDDPRGERSREWYNLMKNHPNHSIDFIIPTYSVKHCAPFPFSETLLCLQHYLDLMEKHALSVNFRFEKGAHGGPRYKDFEWADEKTFKWFYMLGRCFPPAPFLAVNKEVRFHCLMGDFLAKRKIPMLPLDLKAGMGRLYMGPLTQEELGSRLFTYASFYYVFCLGSGFDPSDCIKTVFEQFKAICPMQRIIEYCEKNILLGNPYGLEFRN